MALLYAHPTDLTKVPTNIFHIMHSANIEESKDWLTLLQNIRLVSLDFVFVTLFFPVFCFFFIYVFKHS